VISVKEVETPFQTRAEARKSFARDLKLCLLWLRPKPDGSGPPPKEEKRVQLPPGALWRLQIRRHSILR